MKKIALSFLVYLAFIPAAFAGVYNAQTATLDNGMQVVVIPVHRTPALTHMVWYRVGAADEPMGTSGLAHFLEHLMFKGTPTIPPGQFSKTIQRMGGRDNAFTAWDYTAYFQTVPREKLGDVMRMESERMNNITPKFSDVLSERDVVMEERRQTTEGEPSTLLSERMQYVLFPNHPYGRPIIGWMPEMKTLKWVDALAFYKNHYAPNNAILVVSGDTTLDEVLPLARATYGKLAREDVPLRKRPISPVLDGSANITFARADVRQPVWQRKIRVPSARQNRDDSLALELLEDVLGGSTGKLYQDLVVKNKIATSVGVNYSPYAWDDAVWSVYATPAKGVSFDKLATAIDGVLLNIDKSGLTDQEIAAARARLQDASVYARDSLAGPAMSVGYALANGLSLDDVENWPERLNAVTPFAVQSVLRKYILHQTGVTGYLLPEGGAK